MSLPKTPPLVSCTNQMVDAGHRLQQAVFCPTESMKSVFMCRPVCLILLGLFHLLRLIPRLAGCRSLLFQSTPPAQHLA